VFQRYTIQARRVVFFALYEGAGFGSPSIGTEHLLLGLLRADKELAERILGAHNSSIDSTRASLKEGKTTRPSALHVKTLPLSEESKRVLNYAAEEADGAGHKYIGTEHLLVGLLREEHCRAAKILKEQEVSLLFARERVVRAQDKYYPPDLRL